MVLTDLSDQYEFEAVANARRETEARYRMIFDHVGDVVYSTDTQFRLESLNPAFHRLTGWEINDWIGRSVIDLVHTEDREKLEKLLMGEHQSEDGHHGIEQLRILTKSNKSLVLEIKIQPVIQDERIIGFTGIARDISERKLLALQELQIALEYERLGLLTRFVKNASHDLRTPLSIINSSLYLIQRKLSPADFAKVQSHITTIESQVMHLNEQFNNLFQVSEKHVHNYMDEFVPEPMCELVESVIEQQHNAITNKNQQITFTNNCEPSLVMCAPEDLQRALRHLVVNAINYTPNEGHIMVKLEHSHNMLHLEVEDDGIGIAECEHDNIFEAFYRIDQARGLDTGGMGLGLTIAKAIIEGHGGQIRVKSEEHAGATFMVTLPLHVSSEREHRTMA